MLTADRSLPSSDGGASSSSPVAIRATLTAAPITSAGRCSPLGPLGIRLDLPGRHEEQPEASPPAMLPVRPTPVNRGSPHAAIHVSRPLRLPKSFLALRSSTNLHP